MNKFLQFLCLFSFFNITNSTVLCSFRALDVDPQNDVDLRGQLRDACGIYKDASTPDGKEVFMKAIINSKNSEKFEFGYLGWSARKFLFTDGFVTNYITNYNKFGLFQANFMKIDGGLNYFMFIQCENFSECKLDMEFTFIMENEPTPFPTKSPTPLTNSPTKSPTNSPTNSPTKSPINSPTPTLTESSSEFPVLPVVGGLVCVLGLGLIGMKCMCTSKKDEDLPVVNSPNGQVVPVL